MIAGYFVPLMRKKISHPRGITLFQRLGIRFMIQTIAIAVTYAVEDCRRCHGWSLPVLLRTAMRPPQPGSYIVFAHSSKHNRQVRRARPSPETMESYIIDPNDDNLIEWIETKATGRFQEWKHDCKKECDKDKDGLVPIEFAHRPAQWESFCAHFDSQSNIRTSSFGQVWDAEQTLGLP
ncbi:hypothetical protein LguiA_026879 [Lonicera macranthoides]